MIHDLNSDKPIPTMIWWNKKRIKYNIGLIISGFLAFICYALVMQCIIMPKDPYAEITLFTILFQGVAYLTMMLIANIIFYLGPIIENIVEPIDIDRFRKRTFGFGYWFSFILPFSIPVILIIFNL